MVGALQARHANSASKYAENALRPGYSARNVLALSDVKRLLRLIRPTSQETRGPLGGTVTFAVPAVLCGTGAAVQYGRMRVYPGVVQGVYSRRGTPGGYRDRSCRPAALPAVLPPSGYWSYLVTWPYLVTGPYLVTRLSWLLGLSCI